MGFVTMMTVGYGDHAPVTPGGRLVAGGLMVFGIAALSAATATIAALRVRERAGSVTLEDVMKKLETIESGRKGATDPPYKGASTVSAA